MPKHPATTKPAVGGEKVYRPLNHARHTPFAVSPRRQVTRPLTHGHATRRQRARARGIRFTRRVAAGRKGHDDGGRRDQMLAFTFSSVCVCVCAIVSDGAPSLAPSLLVCLEQNLFGCSLSRSRCFPSVYCVLPYSVFLMGA